MSSRLSKYKTLLTVNLDVTVIGNSHWKYILAPLKSSLTFFKMFNSGRYKWFGVLCCRISTLFVLILINTFLIFSPSNIITYKKKKYTLISVVATLYTYWIALLNIILIVICNPSILNPGPNQDSPKLSVFYQNIRGFVPPTELGEPNPKSLSMEKVLDFQLYIFDKKPDIVILNETWLSKNINESEIFPNEIYKIFRRDRTRSSHPADPNNPTKYRKNGGGVLIAIKNNLDCESIQVKDRCKAEILSVEIRLGCGKSICLSTFYRVGNLEAENHRAVDKYLRGIANRRKFSKVILIGDLNLDEVSWTDGSTSNDLQSDFLDTFDDLNF